MIRNYLSILVPAFLAHSALNAQSIKNDSAIMGPGYTNQVFYDMATGQKGTSTVSSWDIAHTSDVRDNCIRVNHMNGIQVFYYAKDDGDGWASFDTSGFTTWNRYYNDIHDHQKGALNHQSNPPFGIGWGNYNSSSHETVGDSLYLLAWFNGTSYTKFMKFQPVKQTVSGNLIFRYANVDGSNEIQDTLFQSEASGQNYKYYSFATKAKPVREPDKGTWDITFNRYYEPIPAGPVVMMYPVMGVESNRGTKVARIFGPSWTSVIADSSNLMNSYSSELKNDLTAIGSGWKFFDNGQFKWFLADTQSFMIKSVRGTDSVFWLLHFTGFGGSGSGKSVFAKMRLGVTNAVHHPEIGAVSIFPVPASQNIFVAIEGSKVSEGSIYLRDLNGRVLNTVKFTGRNDLSAVAMPLNGIAAGTYMISVESGAHRSSQIVIVQ